MTTNLVHVNRLLSGAGSEMELMASLTSEDKELLYIQNWRNLPTLDTTIICADGECKAHRLVLCHVSPYMGSLLDDQFPGEQTYYSIPDVNEKTMDQLLQLAYTGTVTCASRKELKKLKDAMRFLGWVQIKSCEVEVILTSDDIDLLEGQVLRSNDDTSTKTTKASTTINAKPKDSEKKSEKRRKLKRKKKLRDEAACNSAANIDSETKETTSVSDDDEIDDNVKNQEQKQRQSRNLSSRSSDQESKGGGGSKKVTKKFPVDFDILVDTIQSMDLRDEGKHEDDSDTRNIENERGRGREKLMKLDTQIGVDVGIGSSSSPRRKGDLLLMKVPEPSEHGLRSPRKRSSNNSESPSKGSTDSPTKKVSSPANDTAPKVKDSKSPSKIATSSPTLSRQSRAKTKAVNDVNEGDAHDQQSSNTSNESLAESKSSCGRNLRKRNKTSSPSRSKSPNVNSVEEATETASKSPSSPKSKGSSHTRRSNSLSRSPVKNRSPVKTLSPTLSDSGQTTELDAEGSPEQSATNRRSPSETAIEKNREEKTDAALSRVKRASVRFKDKDCQSKPGSAIGLDKTRAEDSSPTKATEREQSTSPTIGGDLTEGKADTVLPILALATPQKADKSHSSSSKELTGNLDAPTSDKPKLKLDSKSVFSIRGRSRSCPRKQTLLNKPMEEEKNTVRDDRSISAYLDVPLKDQEVCDESSPAGRNERRTRNPNPKYMRPNSRKSKANGLQGDDSVINEEQEEEQMSKVKTPDSKSGTMDENDQHLDQDHVRQDASKKVISPPPTSGMNTPNKSKAKATRRVLEEDDAEWSTTSTGKKLCRRSSLAGTPQKLSYDSPGKRKSCRILEKVSADVEVIDLGRESDSSATAIPSTPKRKRKNSEGLSLNQTPQKSTSSKFASVSSIPAGETGPMPSSNTASSSQDNDSNSSTSVRVKVEDKEAKDKDNNKEEESRRLSGTLRKRPNRLTMLDWKKITTCSICKEASSSPSDTLTCLLNHGHARCWICLNSVPLTYLRRHRIKCSENLKQNPIESPKPDSKPGSSVHDEQEQKLEEQKPSLTSSPDLNQIKEGPENVKLDARNQVTCSWCGVQGESLIWFLRHIHSHKPIGMP